MNFPSVFIPTHRHLKRGSFYQVVGTALFYPNDHVETDIQIKLFMSRNLLKAIPTKDISMMDSTIQYINTVDMQVSSPLIKWQFITIILYLSEDGKLWARSEKEFTDGRFESVIIPKKWGQQFYVGDGYSI